jgi:hypothetical protein
MLLATTACLRLLRWAKRRSRGQIGLCDAYFRRIYVNAQRFDEPVASEGSVSVSILRVSVAEKMIDVSDHTMRLHPGAPMKVNCFRPGERIRLRNRAGRKQSFFQFLALDDGDCAG